MTTYYNYFAGNKKISKRGEAYKYNRADSQEGELFFAHESHGTECTKNSSVRMYMKYEL